ncbi:ribbon-helix-helix protein, CopG family [Sphingomonas bacterium]|uniref:ribbon-helix-helix protein, CopG family n=1 Tax=Sphingomonas bacterium TaxID=1895847 RepID=UPI0015770D02|nr:ribbon-helix-helix protein, CopG family [Sphingomonas bacterium]
MFRLLHVTESLCRTLLQTAAGADMAVIADDGVARVTASLSRAQEQALKDLAAKHKVSVAWLVRHAVDQFLEQNRETQLPLNLGQLS